MKLEEATVTSSGLLSAALLLGTFGVEAAPCKKKNVITGLKQPSEGSDAAKVTS